MKLLNLLLFTALTVLPLAHHVLADDTDEGGLYDKKDDPPLPDPTYEEAPGCKVEKPDCPLNPPGQSTDDGFCQKERFGLYSRKTKKCMSVKGYRSLASKLLNIGKKLIGAKTKPKHLRLEMAPCTPQQKVREKSNLTFHWKPCDSGGTTHFNLAWDCDEGGEYCARKKLFATFFYACDSRSTKYSTGRLSDKGTFQIMTVPQKGQSLCLTSSACLSDKVATKSCKGCREMQWQKLNAEV